MPINDVQTTNRQHAVPQNIMDVEFKIIGDLTMRQFIYLIIFGGIAYASFIIIPGIFKWPLIIVLALMGIAFAFVPIQERGLDEWVINFFRAMYRDNQMIWRKTPEVPTAFSFENLDMVKHELITLTPTSSRRKLEEFLDKQEFETPVDPLDIREDSFVDKLREVYATVEAPVKVATPKVITQQPTPQAQTNTKPQIVEDKSKEEEKTQPATTESTQKQAENKTPATVPTKEIESTQQKQQPEVQPRKKLLATPIGQRPKKQSYARPITPDRHTGRKFTNLLPKQGEIVLPIRGEKVLQTTQEQKIQADIDEKAAQLKQLLEQIKSDEQYNKVIQQSKDVTPPQPKKQEATTRSVENENVQQKVVESDTTQQPPKVEPNMEPSNVKLQQTTTEPKMPTTTPPQPQNNPQSSVAAKTANINPLSDKPNIINGIVKDKEGNSLEGLVLIIKNDKEEPVRAFKTNKLGQFAISTPLANGSYVIETDKSKKTGLTFDIINFEATGAVIPPVEIQGK